MSLYDLKEMDIAYEVTTESTEEFEPSSMAIDPETAPPTPVSQETTELSIKLTESQVDNANYDLCHT